MKTILGLDLGTNSIGWALIRHNFENKEGEILGIGSRIIPMDASKLGDFEKGNPISATADRTKSRGTRRLLERDLLRRERLHRVLNILGFLPEHYANDIDFEHRLGQFKEEKEPKIAYKEISPKKFEFIFQNSFNEMLEDFKKHQPELVSDGKKVPYDWTIYYLRKKALQQKVEKEELAWILLNFNQKRGYYQLRGEEEDGENNIKEYCALLKVISVEKGEKDKKNDKKTWYTSTFENGWQYSATFVTELNWLNTEREFLIREEYDENGNIKIVKDKKADKTGKEKRKITPLPSFDEINLMNKEEQDKIFKKIKARTEITIRNSGLTVGTYIYETLLQEPFQKIRGKLIRTIEREFYKTELEQILNKQIELQPELFTDECLNSCIRELYRNNIERQNELKGKNFIDLFVKDIIFYQRPLKSKKSLISNCSLEFRTFKVDGVERREGIKCIAKSNPIYQEFRLLQWMKNLKIFKIDDKQDIDITDELLPSIADREKLYEWLNDKTEIDQKAFLKYPDFNLDERIKKEIGLEQFRIFKKDKEQGLHTYYRWNYVADKKYPLNETRGEILKRLTKIGISSDFLNRNNETHLWHILYSVEDRNEIISALNKFANKHNLPEIFVDTFRKYPRIDKEYGAYSEKAIKKLLTLMRFGKWWDFSAIDENTKDRVDKIQTGEYDEKIKNRVREKAINLTGNNHFQDLPLWLASYIIYNRHSEASEIKYWRTANDIELLKQHSLRNPIVEQVINETLQTIRDIWNHYGEGKENFFDEIHVELGREMKNPADKRRKITERVMENENTNIRIKAILTELLNEGDNNVRPYSPMQQEILKIYEEGVYHNENRADELNEIDKIRKKSQPSSSDIKRYKLWLEQGYKSPYTGEIIPLSKLFTPAYEIEHIIPQSRFFDDSLSNKVICESEVNSLKDNQLAFEFIKNNKELTIELSHGKFVKLLHPDAYEENVKRYFAKNKPKMRKLLLEDIPDSFIERQMNDTRYISKVVKMLLSNIVREENEEEGTAKNVVVSNGGITNTLKQDWGLNDVWNTLITPRFERLNQMAGYEKYGSWENKEGKQVFQINTIEPELLKLNKKRIDHRHHAMDALIVACSSRNHINYLNNAAAAKNKQSERFDLRAKLRRIENFTDKDGKQRTAAKEFLKPWDTFTQDAKNELEKIIVTFKQNPRVINKTVNYYQKWEKQRDGSLKKVFVKQTKGDSWAIRKPLHKDTVFAEVNLKKIKLVKLDEALINPKSIVEKDLKNKIIELQKLNFDGKEIYKYFEENSDVWNDIDLNKIKVYYFTKDILNPLTNKPKDRYFATRKELGSIFKDEKGKFKAYNKVVNTITESITDTGIQKILLAHLSDKENNPEIAFSPEGIENMNQNIVQLNQGKPHRPILKVRWYEKADKFAIGEKGNRKDKYVEAAKGTNLFFAIYADEEGNRSYETVPLNVVIERQKQGLPSCPATNDKGNRLLFDLSPNDLVYVPTVEEMENPNNVDFNNLSKEQVKRIYNVNDFSGVTIYFTPNTFAKNIAPKELDTSFDSKQSKIENVSIKAVCWKLEFNRLAKITKIIK